MMDGFSLIGLAVVCLIIAFVWILVLISGGRGL